MEFTVAVGWYKITGDKQVVEGRFSRMVNELLDDGWKFRSPMTVKHYVQGENVHVLLVQDFIRIEED